mgnify:FL=1
MLTGLTISNQIGHLHEGVVLLQRPDCQANFFYSQERGQI